MEDPQKDPVLLYNVYHDARPLDMMQDDSRFFLFPGNPNSNLKSWFRKSPIRINKIYQITNEMKADADIANKRVTPYNYTARDCSNCYY